MDHVAWMESNIAASKRQRPTAADRRREKEGRGWYAAPDTLNDFQRRAITILGIVGNGIYNAPISWDGACWDQRFIIVPWHGSLSTFDFTALSRFCFLCHEARIRGDISPKAFQYLTVSLHQRSDQGGMASRHPNLEEAVVAFRQEIGSNHPVKCAAR
jgi:hypothetical protein